MKNPFKPWKEIKSWFKENPFLSGIAVGLFVLSLVSGFVGCASPNPNFNPAQPPSATNPPNVPNKTATDIVAGAGPAASLIPPPYSEILAGVLGLATIIAGTIAKSKNNQAIAASAATTQLATSVAAQGSAIAQAVIQHASNSPQAAPVFAAVNAALPPDPVAPTKTA